MSTSTSDRGAPAAEPGEDAFPEDPRFRTMRRLVTILLIVLIAGALSVVIALILKLKSTSFASPQITAAELGVGPGERLARADATAERVTLLIEDIETGARRVVVLDATDFSVVGVVATERTEE